MKKLTLEEQMLNDSTDKTNRSVRQTRLLFDILGSWKDLIELEEGIKKLMIFYCPGNLAECYYLLAKYRVWKQMNWV